MLLKAKIEDIDYECLQYIEYIIIVSVNPSNEKQNVLSENVDTRVTTAVKIRFF